MECMKICFRCGIEKPLEEYYRHSGMSDGRVNKCKECNKKDVRENYAKRRNQYKEYDQQRQRHSRQRIFNHRYGQIRQRVEGRAVREYKVKGKEILSYEEYCMWIKDNIDQFEKIYRAWEASGFIRKLTPSIDRIDGSRSYTADNMQWLSLSDNGREEAK